MLVKFFAWLATSSLGSFILNFIWGKLVAFVKASIARAQRDKEIEEQTKREAEALKNSRTDDEDEKAAKDILSRH